MPQNWSWGIAPYGGCDIGETPNGAYLNQTTLSNILCVGVDCLVWAVHMSEKRMKLAS
jgi:hypothetical protein